VDTTTSGVEQLRDLMGEGGPGVGITRLLGMRLEVLEEGRVAFSLDTREDMTNAIGVVHGGIAATLLDSALGCAVHSTLKPGEQYTTVDLHVHFTRAIAVGLGKIVATGDVVHRGSRLATAEGRVTDASGKLLAHGTTTCMVMPA
jgi:uncharacterized protein (TIGR00369 family)